MHRINSTILFLLVCFQIECFAGIADYTIQSVTHSSFDVVIKLKNPNPAIGLNDHFKIVFFKKGEFSLTPNQLDFFARDCQDLGNGKYLIKIIGLISNTTYRVKVFVGSSITAGQNWTQISGPKYVTTSAVPINCTSLVNSFGGDMWFKGDKSIHAPIVGDFNNDGFDDIVYYGLCGSGTDCWRVHLNNKNGQFTATTYGGDMWFKGDKPIYAPIVGDFNNDGFDDIVYYGLCGSGTDCWRVHLNNKNGQFTATTYGGDMWFKGDKPIYAPIIGDFNNDGFDDIVYYGLCGIGTDCWRVHLNNKNGQFTATTYGGDMWLKGDKSIHAPIVGDFNNDGFDDIVYYGLRGNNFETWRKHINTQNGNFSTSPCNGNFWFKGDKPIHAPIVGDFNNDGFDDIVYYGLCGSGTDCWRNEIIK